MSREVLEESRELRIVLCREQKNGPRVKSSVVAACGEHSPFYFLGPFFVHLNRLRFATARAKPAHNTFQSLQLPCTVCTLHAFMRSGLSPLLASLRFHTWQLHL